MGSYKIKMYCPAKATITKGTDSKENRRKISANYTSGRGLVYKV